MTSREQHLGQEQMIRSQCAAFECPLRGPCFATPRSGYGSRHVENLAVREYQARRRAGEGADHATEIFLRHVPLVWRTLRRFCARSRCQPGGCLVEELIGESYPAFVQIMDAWDGSRGVDFLGYASRRLAWALEHKVRAYRSWTRASEIESTGSSTAGDDVESDRLDELFVNELLDRLSAEDAQLFRRRYAAGQTSRELSEQAGVTDAAIRKRLERIRDRLRALAGSSDRASAEAGRGPGQVPLDGASPASS